MECYYGDFGGRRRHGGTEVGAPKCQVGIGVCLDQTFQDAGGWLAEVVDEDPVQRQDPPGSQFCEKIGGVIVLSRDMM